VTQAVAEPGSTAAPKTRIGARLGASAALAAVSLLCVSDAGVRVAGALGDNLKLFSLGGLNGGEATEAEASVVGPQSVVIQAGEDNLARIMASGAVQSLVSQFGSNNEVQLRQDGDGLVSVVEQGRAPGAASAFEAELARRPAAADPFGGVSGNRAFIDQAGVNNRSLVGQFGTGASADVIQRGAGNLSSLFQVGTDASAFVSQAGERNSSIIMQHDFAVRANIVQTGEDGLSEARQWDQSSGSIAQVFQAGSRGMSDIDQAGVRNLATVVQWDQGERAASTVIQDGDQGEVRVDQAGVELVSIVRQTAGLGNVAEVYQVGLNNVSEIAQSGVANRASAHQSDAGNRSTIIQSGSNNVAAVRQSGL
jgi:hypothetical protein